MNLTQLKELTEALEKPINNQKFSYKFTKVNAYHWYMFFNVSQNRPDVETDIDLMILPFTRHEAITVERTRIQGDVRIEFIVDPSQVSRLSPKLCNNTLVSTLIRWGHCHV